MKRHGNLYHKIYDFDNLILAHKKARQNKAHYDEVQDVDKYRDYCLEELQKQLITKTYKTSKYVIFNKVEGGKERVLYKLPYFPDRICQWAIMNVIQPILYDKLIANTFSAITGRGIHLANKKMRSCLAYDIGGTQHFAKIDIKKYYPSIDKEILKAQYERIFKDKELLWLINEIIDSTPEEKGIPIGNFLSQWSGNLYLSPIDHWFKEVARVKHYFRYMDDIVFFGEAKDELQKLESGLQVQLDKLKLRLKHDYQIHKTDERGVDFVGFRFFRDYALLRKRTVKNLKNKMNQVRVKVNNGKDIAKSNVCCFYSYCGILNWCNGRNLFKAHMQDLEKYIKNSKGGKK